MERKEYVPVEAILDELRRKIDEGLEADFVTISGSGEPTLHSKLGTIVDEIHRLTGTPVAIITNGTLLCREDVRRDCARADLVMPSLDAGSPEVFEKINKPHKDIDFEQFAEGLVQFRREFKGRYWLEVFFCEGINTDDKSVSDLKMWIDKIHPDRVQVNTSVRPVVHKEAAKVEAAKLHEIAMKLGTNAEVIADYSREANSLIERPDSRMILETLRRRPCSLEDLCRGLGLHPLGAQKTLAELKNEGKIEVTEKNGTLYYTAN
jgi:wyosine [tRNA(Phe)-imidazoG37] synthetase (radical SAM superfamily)